MLRGRHTMELLVISNIYQVLRVRSFTEPSRTFSLLTLTSLLGIIPFPDEKWGLGMIMYLVQDDTVS